MLKLKLFIKRLKYMKILFTLILPMISIQKFFPISIVIRAPRIKISFTAENERSIGNCGSFVRFDENFSQDKPS